MLTVQTTETDTMTLERCPSRRPESGRTCSPSCVACHEGPIDDIAYSYESNRLLAYFAMLSGTTQLLGLSEMDGDPSHAHSVRLYVNNTLFRDEAGTSIPTWALIASDRSNEEVYVSVVHDGVEAERLYRAEVADGFEDPDCDADHPVGTTCWYAIPAGSDVGTVPQMLIAREQHCLLTTFPDSRCMCGLQLHTPNQVDDYPTAGMHLDAVANQR